MKRYVKEMINDLKFNKTMEKQNERCAEYNKKLDRLLWAYNSGLITSQEVVKTAASTEY